MTLESQQDYPHQETVEYFCDGYIPLVDRIVESWVLNSDIRNNESLEVSDIDSLISELSKDTKLYYLAHKERLEANLDIVQKLSKMILSLSLKRYVADLPWNYKDIYSHVEIDEEVERFESDLNDMTEWQWESDLDKFIDKVKVALHWYFTKLNE